MLAVHVGPTDIETPIGRAYAAPHGRASILFMLVAGVGVTLFAASRRTSPADTRLTLLWRAAVLLPLGMVEWEALRAQSSTEWITYYDTVVDSVYAAAVIITVIAFSRVVPPFADRIEMIEPFLQPKVAEVVGAQFVAQKTGELFILLEERMFPIGAEYMVTVLDLVEERCRALLDEIT